MYHIGILPMLLSLRNSYTNYISDRPVYKDCCYKFNLK